MNKSSAGDCKRTLAYWPARRLTYTGFVNFHLMVYLGLLITCAVGWLVLPHRMELAPLPRLGFAFAAGAAALSVQMFAYDLAGLIWSRFSLLPPWMMLAAFVLYRRGGWVRLPPWPKPAWWQVVLAACLLIPLFVWLPFERVMPLTSQSWDAWAIWLFKAQAFYLDGGIDPYLERGGEFANHPGYPLLVPLYGTFLYVLNGGVADHAAKLMTPCFYLALLGVFYHFARRFGSPMAALAFTVMTASAPMIGTTAFALAGYADTTLSVYCVAAAGFLYAWYREGRMADLAGASLAATAAAWTKNEGQFFLLGVVLLAAGRLVKGRFSPPEWGWLLAPPALVLVPWALVREAHGIEAAGFVPGASFHADLFWISIRAVAARAADLGSFNLTFFLFLGSLAAANPLRISKAFWIVPGLVLWHLSGALLAYSTGRNDINWWLQTSADRILAQIAPVALLPPVLVFCRWFERAETSPRAEPAPADRAGAKQGRKRKRRSR